MLRLNEMKYLILILASLLLMTPQVLSQQQGPSLSVLSTYVEVVTDYSADYRAMRTPARAASAPAGHTEAASVFDMLDDAADKSMGKKYKVSIILRNDSSKLIRAVTVECPLRYSHDRGPEHLRFKVRREIQPGQTLTLSHSFISSRQVVLRTGEQAIIKSIAYQDGSIWRR
jgi:hypothetical protein